MRIGHDGFDLEFHGQANRWWSYAARGGRTHAIAAPEFPIDGAATPAAVSSISELRPPRVLANGCTERVLGGPLIACPDLVLELVLRTAPEDPVVRFQYRLSGTRADAPRRLHKPEGHDQLVYGRLSLAGFPRATEILLSEFQEPVHSFCPAEREIPVRRFEHGLAAMGPILVAEGAGEALLLAYEHGSQAPDAFVQFRLSPDRGIAIEAVKGNYHRGRAIVPGEPLTTLWLQVAVVIGSMDDLAAAYRRFVLWHLSLTHASREPLVFYNTWNYQERNKWWNGKAFLTSMTEERILAEIDVAHRMGIEVFVIDTGWYSKTGDWRVDRARFPDGMKSVKERLDRHGMRLGLWFGPLHAASTSRMLADHDDCVMSWRGTRQEAVPIWESEASSNLCLVSRYADAFADELVRLSREIGVTYFKWDGIGQYGCDDPGHRHGAADNDAQERGDCYAFEQVRAMVRIVERVQEACPDAIVDFDITEGGRSVGLAFLSAGKYFLINNGPYHPNYDLATDGYVNIFVHPGQARTWICRAPLGFDRWIPSVLFLTHYLPDDPVGVPTWATPHAPLDSQDLNLASLMLGQNGIWGDLPAVSERGIIRFGDVLARYRRVRDAITAASPVRQGAVGSSAEVHEKLAGGRGLVAVFSTHPGTYDYVTAGAVAETWWANAPEDVDIRRDHASRAVMTLRFPKPGVRFVLFG